MKIIKLEEIKEFKNSDSCCVLEYPLDDKDINIALAKINGRYPENSFALNTECKEIGYVVEGVGKLVVENKTIELKKGDVILIEVGEKFYWEGDLEILMPCAPAWTPEQYKIISEN